MESQELRTEIVSHPDLTEAIKIAGIWISEHTGKVDIYNIITVKPDSLWMVHIYYYDLETANGKPITHG